MYAFAGLVAALILGNLILRIRRQKTLQLRFTFAIAVLLLIDVCLVSKGTYFNLLSVSNFSLFFVVLFTAGMLLLNLLAFARSSDYADFAVLSSFSLAGMYLLSFSASLVSIFIALELVSIPSSFIILLSRKESLEAATKYFVMASVAIAILSFAIVLVYGASNNLSLAPLQQRQQTSSLLSFAFILFVAALGFEASIFPFNVLLPDVYQGSAAYATAMLGGLNKKAGFAALLQALILVFVSSHFAFVVVATLAVLTMFYGNLGALVQDNFKRMLAYSSISQSGYILIGIAVATQAGIGASLVQIFAHTFLFIGTLGIAAWLESKERNEVNDFIGLYKENKFAAVALTIFLLSLAGLPFTTGFIGKFLIFLSAVNANLVWLAILGIINSVVSIFYYAKVMTAVYTNKLGAYRMRFDPSTMAVVVSCLAITIFLGLYPQPLIQLTNNAAGYLLTGV